MKLNEVEKRLHELFDLLEQDHYSIYEYTLFHHAYWRYGMSPVEIMKIIHRLIREDKLYSPRPGFYKRLNDTNS